jgi:hypothetical protein
MTELELLDHRRALVVLSADLQRATLSRRLARVQDSPGRAAFDLALEAASRPDIRRATVVVALFAWRALRRARFRN